MKTIFNNAFIWMSAMSAGSLMTSIGFYINYDQWKPMVVSASVVACVQILYSAFGMLEKS